MEPLASLWLGVILWVSGSFRLVSKFKFRTTLLEVSKCVNFSITNASVFNESDIMCGGVSVGKGICCVCVCDMKDLLY